MNIALPTNIELSCREYHEVASGKYKFIGYIGNDDKYYNLIVVDEAENKVVNTFRTKMKTMKDIQFLLSRIASDRDLKIYRPFKVYSNAWMNKGILRIPYKKEKTS